MKGLVKAGIGVLAAAAIITVPALPAYADAQPSTSDVVGVGSDTIQYAMDFLFEGDPAGHNGCNNGFKGGRVFNFDATGDSNGKLTPNATAVLRRSTNPVSRPNGSGGGINALLADTGATEQINFVRSSRLPTATEATTAANTADWGGLHVFQFATDGLTLGVRQAGTNAPAALPASELVQIYSGNHKTWGQVPGYSGPAPSATIHPYLPQTGSGTRSSFLSDLKAANGGVDVTVDTTGFVKTSEEQDASVVVNDPDAIEPFSTARISLINTGYFGPSLVNSVTTLTGAGTYSTTRGVYIIVRERDVTDHTGLVQASGLPFPWQPGGTKNWVETLFGTPSTASLSCLGRSSNATLIQSAGFASVQYQDLGNAHS